MKNKVIVNGIDVFKDIEYKENLIQDLKDVISKQEKLLGQYKKVASAIVRISIEQPIYVIRESEREMVEQSFNRIKELENDK